MSGLLSHVPHILPKGTNATPARRAIRHVKTAVSAPAARPRRHQNGILAAVAERCQDLIPRDLTECHVRPRFSRAGQNVKPTVGTRPSPRNPPPLGRPWAPARLPPERPARHAAPSIPAIESPQQRPLALDDPEVTERPERWPAWS